MAIDSNYKHSELTELVIGTFYEVYSELGFGFLESVYRNALRLALMEKGMTVEQEAPVTVFFRDKSVGDFRADLIVNGVVLLELKTADHIVAAHESQVLNYLKINISGTRPDFEFWTQTSSASTAFRQSQKAR